MLKEEDNLWESVFLLSYQFWGPNLGLRLDSTVFTFYLLSHLLSSLYHLERGWGRACVGMREKRMTIGKRKWYAHSTFMEDRVRESVFVFCLQLWILGNKLSCFLWDVCHPFFPKLLSSFIFCSVPCTLLGNGTDVPLKCLVLFSFLVLWSSLCSYHWAVQKCSSYQIVVALVYEHRHSYLEGNITSIPCLFTKKAVITFSLELIQSPTSSDTMVYSSKREFSHVEW